MVCIIFPWKITKRICLTRLSFGPEDPIGDSWLRPGEASVGIRLQQVGDRLQSVPKKPNGSASKRLAVALRQARFCLRKASKVGKEAAKIRDIQLLDSDTHAQMLHKSSCKVFHCKKRSAPPAAPARNNWSSRNLGRKTGALALEPLKRLSELFR